MNHQEYLHQIDDVIAQGPFTNTWDSLCQYKTAEWYKNDKFGIFIHWGVYSVPAFGNEWYPRNMYLEGSPENLHHKKTYGDLGQFGYKDFIPMFRAEHFDPKAWVDLFQEAGAKFVMPVAEHHDGFQMYESDLSHWNAQEMGPKRDILGELKAELEAHDLKFTASSHRAEHWWFYNGGRQIPGADVNDPANATLYAPAAGISRDWHSLYDNSPDDAFMQDWLVRTCELVDRYQPRIVFFDWWIQQVSWKPYLQKFAAYYYNRAAQWGVEVAINAKFDAYVHGSAVKDIERGQLSSIYPTLWQNDTSVAKNSWGYTVGNDYKESYQIVSDLVDVVSKNGALLLNIGPKPDGTIPEEDATILREIGAWLAVNGEAIYDTTYWKVFGEGPTEIPEGNFTDTNRSDFGCEDIRYTAKSNHIYATVMRWPEDGTVRLKSLGYDNPLCKSSIRDVEILGYDVHPHIERRATLEVEAKLDLKDKMPVVIKITID